MACQAGPPSTKKRATSRAGYGIEWETPIVCILQETTVSVGASMCIVRQPTAKEGNQNHRAAFIGVDRANKEGPGVGSEHKG